MLCRRQDGNGTLYYYLEFTVRSPTLFRHNVSVYAARYCQRVENCAVFIVVYSFAAAPLFMVHCIPIGVAHPEAFIWTTDFVWNAGAACCTR